MMKKISDKLTSWIFLTPTFIFVSLTALIPLTYALFISFYKVKLNIPNYQPKFLFFGNYLEIFTDFLFRQSTINTVVFVVVTVLLEMVLGLILAMLLSSDRPLTRILSTIFLVPMIMAPVVSGTLWRMILDRTTGLFNYLLGFVGITAIPWLAQTTTARISIIFVDVWRWTPWVAIILTAAWRTISISILEAAIVDGVTPWQLFRKIILPTIKPILTIVFMIRTIDAFKVFDTVYVMTYGGPGMATEMLPTYIYKQGLVYFKAGYASALAWIFIFTISIFIYFIIRSWSKESTN